PLKKGKKSTYLFNYRYTTLAFLGKLTNFSNIPTFQILTIKFDFLTVNAGTLSLFAMGADDQNNKAADANTLKRKTDNDRKEQDYYNRFGVVGLSHRITIG